MTLISRTSIRGEHFLFGDALYSTSEIKHPEVAGWKCELPLVGDVNNLLAAQNAPFRTKLCQKLHIFEGRLAVGWSSNDSKQAVRALKVLREEAKKPDLAFDDVKKALSAIGPEIDGLSLIGGVLRGGDGHQGCLQLFCSNEITEKIEGFDEVVSAGSGASAFHTVLRENGPPRSGGSAMLPLLGALLNYELSTGQSIGDKWGGAFEAVNLSQSSAHLEKFGNVLHTFWSWSGDGKIQFQPRFYLTRYFDELLVLRSAEFEAGESVANPIKGMISNNVQLVGSILRDVTPVDHAKLGHVDFAYDYVCAHVWIYFAGDPRPRASYLVGGPRGSGYDVDISIKAGGLVHLGLPSGTTENVYKAAQEMADKLKPRE